MHEHASDDGYELSDYVWASLHARKAAEAETFDRHVWSLELALSPLRRCAVPTVLRTEYRDSLRADLIAAHETSQRLLSGRYPAEQIEYGYRAAHVVLDGWAIPLDEGRRNQRHGVCDTVLGIFLFDVVNMRRATDLTAKLCGSALHAMLPPLPRMPVTTSCVVIPFPGHSEGPST